MRNAERTLLKTVTSNNITCNITWHASRGMCHVTCHVMAFAKIAVTPMAPNLAKNGHTNPHDTC